MKVAYLVPAISQPNGWRSHATGFLNAVSQYVTPVLFVAREDAQAAAELFPQFQRFTLPAVQYMFQKKGQYSRMFATMAAIKIKRFPDVDLVHSMEAYPAGLFGSQLAAKLNRPHLLTAHGTYCVLAYKSNPHKALYQGVLRKASAIAPVSPHTGEIIQGYFPEATKNLYIQPILNGSNFSQTISREEALCRQPDEIPTILSVGAIKPRKGYHLSLAAFAQLKRSIPNARYWIVGEPGKRKYADDLKASIAAQGLKDVRWLGKVPQSQLYECYRAASVFLLTPLEIDMHFEGFGLVYLEAGAFGLPVVGARTGGVPSAIRDGETGYVVEPEDIHGLAEALRLLLTDRELALRMGLANRQWAETLTWEKNAREHAELYRQVIDAWM